MPHDIDRTANCSAFENVPMIVGSQCPQFKIIPQKQEREENPANPIVQSRIANHDHPSRSAEPSVPLAGNIAEMIERKADRTHQYIKDNG